MKKPNRYDRELAHQIRLADDGESAVLDLTAHVYPDGNAVLKVNGVGWKTTDDEADTIIAVAGLLREARIKAGQRRAGRRAAETRRRRAA